MQEKEEYQYSMNVNSIKDGKLYACFPCDSYKQALNMQKAFLRQNKNKRLNAIIKIKRKEVNK